MENIIMENIIIFLVGIVLLVFALTPTKFTIKKKVLNSIDYKSPIFVRSGIVRSQNRQGLLNSHSIIKENVKELK